MPGEDADHGRPPAQVITELVAAICAGRVEDALALVDPAIEWQPVTRPARSLYRGHSQIARFIADLSAAYGRYRIEIDDVTAETGAQATAEPCTRFMVRTHVVRETDQGDLPLPVITSAFTFHNGLVASVYGDPDPEVP
jgi:hypothetical protein